MNNEYSRIVSALNLLFKNPCDKLQAIVLSKGGWEGWLQCELWNLLNDGFEVEGVKYKGKSYTREERYVDGSKFCDLVDYDKNFWIELKAYGLFRDLESFTQSFNEDIKKIGQIDAPAIAVVVIPYIYDVNLEADHVFWFNSFTVCIKKNHLVHPIKSEFLFHNSF